MTMKILREYYVPGEEDFRILDKYHLTISDNMRVKSLDKEIYYNIQSMKFRLVAILLFYLMTNIIGLVSILLYVIHRSMYLLYYYE